MHPPQPRLAGPLRPARWAADPTFPKPEGQFRPAKGGNGISPEDLRVEHPKVTVAFPYSGEASCSLLPQQNALGLFSTDRL
jgi:hypothetical protein